MKNDIRKKLALAGVLFAFTGACSIWPAKPVSAGTAETVLQQMPRTELWAADGSLLQDDILCAGFARQLSDDGTHMAGLRSSHAGKRLTGNGKRIYDFLKTKIEKVAAGEQTSTQFQLPVREILDQLEYTEKELGVLFYNPDTHKIIPEKEQSQVLNQFMNQWILTDQELHNLFNSLLMDCPYELYWYDKAAEGSFRLSLDGAQIRNNGASGACLTVERAVLTFGFLVDGAYGSQYQTNAYQIGTVRQAVANAEKIVRQADGLTDYQKLVYYRKKICDLTSYNKGAASTRSPGNQNPWQLVYVFDEDDTTNVVCEGYAKAFQYLCDNTVFDDPEICSYIVAGTMTGGTTSGLHMWNIVHMGDLGNYLVDVTNCDEGAVGADDALFLTGYTSGNETDGYSIVVSSKTVSYQYRPYMAEIYSKEDLTLVRGGRLKESDRHEHSWGEAQIADASCTAAGKKIYTCLTCGRTKTEEIAASGHAYEASFQWSENNTMCTIAFVCKYDSSHRLMQTTEPGEKQEVRMLEVKDPAGNVKYKLNIDLQDLSAGNSLSVYRLDEAAGAYRLVDDKTYTVSPDGSISVSLQDNQTYQLFNAAQAEQMNEEILKTVAAERASVAVKKGKSTMFRFNSGMHMENVKSISYTSSKKAVAKVSAKGKITAKKAGTAVVKAKVTLKNGMAKTVPVKVKVK